MAVLVAGSLIAQETTGGVVGSVTSADGAPLAGVTVTVVDPARGFERSTTAGVKGAYALPALVPASYELTASLPGFRSATRSIEVELGRTVTNDFVLELGEFSGAVEVTGEPPLVDVTSTVAGFTASTAELEARLPLVREVTQVALLAPGTMQGDEDFGSERNTARGYTPKQSPVSIGGASVAETGYQVNGLDISNFRNGIGSSLVPFTFLDQVQVKTGGYEAEFGRATGGVINMTTKSGTNRFRGGIDAFWQPESLQENQADTVWQQRSLESLDSFEANVSLGGPVLQDRLFFFAFASWDDSDHLLFKYDRAEREQTQAPLWGGKVDWNLSSAHRFEGTYFSDAIDVDQTLYALDDDGRAGEVIGTGVMARGGDNWIGRYSGLLSDRLLVTAEYGENSFNRTTSSPQDDICPLAFDDREHLSEAIGCWVNFYTSRDVDQRQAARADLDFFIGAHSLRGGIDREEYTSLGESVFSGGVAYRYFRNSDGDGDGLGDIFPERDVDEDVVRVRHQTGGGTVGAESRAAYLQDGWAVRSNLTVNLGVRYEKFANQNTRGETFLTVDDQWAPRLGVVWDPGNDGRTKVYASFGRYHLPAATVTNLILAAPAYFDEQYFAYSGGIDPVLGSPGSLDEELGALVILWDGAVPDPRGVAAASLEPVAQDELMAGYERTVGEHWSVGVRAVHRSFVEVIEDANLAPALWEVYGVPCLDPERMAEPPAECAGSIYSDYRLLNPGSDFSGWYDLDGDGVLDPVSLTAEEIGLPEAERTYAALEVSARRRFADRWMFSGSYTWSHLYGNYEGSVNSDTSNDMAGLSQTFDYASAMEYASGDLPNDRRHNLKLFGAFSWDSGLQVGASFWYRSGRPINGFGTHPTDPWINTPGVAWFPSFYSGGEPCPRGCAGRTPGLWSLDLSLRYDFAVAGLDCNARVDVFNLTDNGEVTEVGEDAEYLWETNPYYLGTVAYQTPRRVRLGVGVSF